MINVCFFSSHFKLGCQHLNTVWRILPNLLGERAGYPQVRPKKFCQFWSKKVIFLVIFNIFLAFFGPFKALFGPLLTLCNTKTYYIVHLVFVSFGYVFIMSDNVLGIWYLVGRRDDLALN